MAGRMMETDGGRPLEAKACDECRHRKIRCNRIKPCYPCASAGRSCSFSPKQHLQNPRQRILVSKQYEEKVDQINDRVQEIEQSLRRLVSQTSTPRSRERPSVTPSVAPSDSTESLDDLQVDDQDDDFGANKSPFSDDFALQKQCAHVREFLESVVVPQLAGEALGSNTSVAVTTLRELGDWPKRGLSGDGHGDQSFPLQKSICLEDLRLPPLKVVSFLLNKIDDEHITIFSSNCALVGLTATDFRSLCTAVYVAPDRASHSALTILNAGLRYIFLEQEAHANRPELEKEYATWARLCERNLSMCIRSAPLFASDMVRHVQALLLGVMYAIDACWPSVAWYLNSAAGQLCQTGGFHRVTEAATDESPAARTKRTLFWTAFMFDKCLSLRLGYASTIRETDITVPRDLDLNGVDQLGRGGLPHLWLITSSLRATTYERLYSPEALACSPAEMAQRARELGSECRAMEMEVIKICAEASVHVESYHQSELIRLYIDSATVQFYTLTTLVYRMIPPPEGSPHRFTQECIEAARNAFRQHLSTVQQLGTKELYKAIYVNWTMMLTPFAPLFVIFCHVITVLDPGDMELLQNFVASLRDLKSATRTGEKMHQLCNAMWDVACACYGYAYTFNLNAAVDADQTAQTGTEGGFGDEFNMFLNQLEFEFGGDVQVNQMPELGDWLMSDVA